MCLSQVLYYQSKTFPSQKCINTLCIWNVSLFSNIHILLYQFAIGLPIIICVTKYRSTVTNRSSSTEHELSIGTALGIFVIRRVPNTRIVCEQNGRGVPIERMTNVAGIRRGISLALHQGIDLCLRSECSLSKSTWSYLCLWTRYKPGSTICIS